MAHFSVHLNDENNGSLRPPPIATSMANILDRAANRLASRDHPWLLTPLHAGLERTHPRNVTCGSKAHKRDGRGGGGHRGTS